MEKIPYLSAVIAILDLNTGKQSNTSSDTSKDLLTTNLSTPLLIPLNSSSLTLTLIMVETLIIVAQLVDTHHYGRSSSELEQSSPSTLLINNNSAITIVKNSKHHGRMKYLDLQMQWLHDTVEAGLISPIHVPTTSQAADILTKPLK